MGAPASVTSIDVSDGCTVCKHNSAIDPGKSRDLTVDKVTIGTVPTGSSTSVESLRRTMTATSAWERGTMVSCRVTSKHGATVVNCGGKSKMAT